MYLTNIKRRTKAGNCPTCRSVNICEGPKQLETHSYGTHKDQNTGEPTQRSVDNKLRKPSFYH